MTDELSRIRRPGRTVAAVVAIVIAVAGCGASASVVKKGPATSASSSTTAAPTTEAPTTTGGSTTVDGSTTTTPGGSTTTPAGGSALPAALKDQLLQSCEAGDTSKAPMCECWLRAIEAEVTTGDLSGLLNGNVPSDLENTFVKTLQECRLDPTSH